MNALSENERGAVYMMVSMGCFVISDSIMKSFAGQLAWYEALAWRGGIGTTLCLGLALAIDGRRSLGEVIGYLGNLACAARIVCELFATMFFLLSLFNMPLADASAILQSVPLLLMLGGAVFFGEKIGWRRLGAAMAGFVGVLLIIQPGSEAFKLSALYALAAALSMAGRDLFTKGLPMEIPSTYVNFLTTLAVWILGVLLSFPGGWPSIGAAGIGLLTLSAVLIALGFLFGIMTMRTGEMSFIAPFRFSFLIWALVIGIFVFDEVPGPLKVVGAVILVAAGLYTFAREQKDVRRRDKPLHFDKPD